MISSAGKQQGALEARKKCLMEDEDVAEVEPHRVRCVVCNSWVKLRHDCSYSLGKWMVHKRRCGDQTRDLQSDSAHSDDDDEEVYVNF